VFTLLIFFSSCVSSETDSREYEVGLNAQDEEVGLTTPIPEEGHIMSEVITIDENSIQALKEAALVGFWQDFPGVAAGFSSRYVFFVNYDFIYLANQMCLVNPERGHSGTWRIINNELELTITTKNILEGGVQEPCPILGIYWRGATLNTIVLEEPEVIRLSLSSIVIREDPTNDYQIGNHKIKIGGDSYWKFNFFDDLFDMFRWIQW